jgi:hypothetical protein
VLVVEIVPSAAGGELDTNGAFTNVHLLHGKLDVSLRSNPGGAPVRLESLQTVTVTRDVLGKMRPLDLATAGAVTTGLKPNQQAVTAIPEKLQAAVDQRQGVLALATALEMTRGVQSPASVKGRSGKAEPTGIAKAGDAGTTRDANIIPVAEVSEGAGALVGSVFGALDVAVSSLGTGGGSDSGIGGGNGSGNGGGNGSGNGGGNGSGNGGGNGGNGSGNGGGNGGGNGSGNGGGNGGGNGWGNNGGGLGIGGGNGGGNGSGNGGGNGGGFSGGGNGGGNGGGRGPSVASGGGGGGNLFAPVLGFLRSRRNR